MNPIDMNELARYARSAPRHLWGTVLQITLYPTERNRCYATGYIGAMRNCGALDAEAHAYWLAFLVCICDPSFSAALRLDIELLLKDLR